MNLMPIAVVDQLINEHAAHIEAMKPNRLAAPPSEPHPKMGSSALERYAAKAVDGEYQALATAPEGQGRRYPQLLTSASKLASIANSDWGAPFLPNDAVYDVLLLASTANGLVDVYGEAHLRRAVDWCLANVTGRPEPVGKAFVPIVEYKTYSTIGTDNGEGLVEPEYWTEPGDTPEEVMGDVEPAWKHSEEERAEIAEFFPLPRGNDGKSVRPDMFELARVRRDNPRRAATDLVISNGWKNPANAVYHRRQLFGFLRRAFQEHLADGGLIYKTVLRVPTATEDDANLLKEERKAWDKIRKRLQRSESCCRWFSTSRPGVGVFREIYSSEPTDDGQEPLAEPEVALLDTLMFTTALPPPGQGAEGDDGSEVLPYHRRKAHDGFDDAWKPKNVANGKWITIGTRSSRALLEMNQDVYDEEAAVNNGFRTWRAAVDEVHARSERIVQTRHWVAPVSKPVDALPRLFEELEFRILWTRWDALFNDGLENVPPEPPPWQMGLGVDVGHRAVR